VTLDVILARQVKLLEVAQDAMLVIAALTGNGYGRSHRSC
jgi:hypothetical protein